MTVEKMGLGSGSINFKDKVFNKSYQPNPHRVEPYPEYNLRKK